MAAVPANAFNNGIKGVIVFRFELVKIKEEKQTNKSFMGRFKYLLCARTLELLGGRACACVGACTCLFQIPNLIWNV